MGELTLNDYLAIFQRQRRIYFLTVLVIFLISLIFVGTWSSYKSTATIQIQSPEIPAEMTVPLGENAANFVQDLADQRIQQIQQKLLASSNLVDIITKFNLYPQQRERRAMTDVIDIMRAKIRLDLLGSELSNPASAQKMSVQQLAAIAFTITFTYTNPVIAQQVANELTSRFLDEDIRQRRLRAQQTSTFLGAQVDDLEKNMADQEKRIADFRAAHADNRPESLAFNQQMVATTEMSLQDLDRQMASLERTEGDLKVQLAGVDPYSRVVADGQVLTTPSIQLKALQAKYATLQGQYGPSHPDVIKLGRQIAALEAETGGRSAGTGDSAAIKAEIADTRANLAAAEKTYGPGHPDVQALRRRLADQQKRLASATSTDRSGTKHDADNPAYLMLQAQLRSAESQYQAAVTQKQSLESQRNHYRQMVAETPSVERELAALSRDYDNSQLRYRELKEKKLTADMGVQMQEGRQGERLVVTDPPALPTDTSPRRIVLLATGLFLALLGGFGGIYLAELTNRNVRGTRHLEQLIGVQALVAIPHIATHREVLAIRMRRMMAVGVLAIGTAASLAAINTYFMPLDVLWSIISLRLNLF